MPRTYRVVVARRGSHREQIRADLVARALRDAGFEVIYAPPSAGLDQLAEAALQEDADAVGMPLGSPLDEPVDEQAELNGELASRGIEDVLVFTTEGDPAEIVARIERGLGVDGVS